MTTRATLRRQALSLAVLVLTAVTAGCSSSSAGLLTLSGAELDIENCDTLQDIAVEELDTMPPTCRPVGSTLVFPSGARATVHEGGGSAMAQSTTSITTSVWQDVAAYGVVAGEYQRGCTNPQAWGPSNALAKVRDAFDEQWPCDPSEP